VEAAHVITWRPLGQLLVEQGLLTGDELEHALARQQQTGKRLGETIVACGFVSGPELASALAAQYGLELTTEQGFGTGLRSEIQRRHESERGRTLQSVPDPVRLVEVPAEPLGADQPPELVAPAEPAPAEESLLAQLEEQWARLAAAEASLAARDAELAEQRRLNAEQQAELDERRLEPRADAPPPPSSHLVFVQLSGRYQLLEREGPPPPASSLLELPEGGSFVVAGSRRSPLPGDGRPCLVLEPS
jgi:hypothetical protein